jgi:uncharacterized membrane protein required for colicin V production
VIAAVLIAGALIGAHRGLFKSLMGAVVVLAALVGSVMLANILTEPVTDVVAPKVEDAVVSQFSDALDKKEQETGERIDLKGLLEKYHISGDVIDKLTRSLSETVQHATGQAKEQAVQSFRGAVSAAIRSMVSGAVHTVLVLVLYIVLLIVLKLLTRALDHVLDAPVLGTLNGAGGAALGLIEAVLLLYAVIYVGAHLGVKAITQHANDTYLLPLFLNHSPVELISSLNNKA